MRGLSRRWWASSASATAKSPPAPERASEAPRSVRRPAERAFYDDAHTFSSLGLSPCLTSSLARAGLRTPSRAQSMALPPLLRGQSAVLAAETGSGKTLAYLAPLLQRALDEPEAEGRTTLVLCANAALCVQVLSQARALGVNLAALPPSLHPKGGKGWVVRDRSTDGLEEFGRVAGIDASRIGQELEASTMGQESVAASAIPAPASSPMSALGPAFFAHPKSWPPERRPSLIVGTPSGVLEVLRAVERGAGRRAAHLWSRSALPRWVRRVVLDEADLLLGGSYGRGVEELLEIFQRGDRRAQLLRTLSALGASEEEHEAWPPRWRRLAAKEPLERLRERGFDSWWERSGKGVLAVETEDEEGGDGDEKGGDGGGKGGDGVEKGSDGDAGGDGSSDARFAFSDAHFDLPAHPSAKLAAAEQALEAARLEIPRQILLEKVEALKRDLVEVEGFRQDLLARGVEDTDVEEYWGGDEGGQEEDEDEEEEVEDGEEDEEDHALPTPPGATFTMPSAPASPLPEPSWRRQYVFAAATMPQHSRQDVGSLLAARFPEALWLRSGGLHRGAAGARCAWLALPNAQPERRSQAVCRAVSEDAEALRRDPARAEALAVDAQRLGARPVTLVFANSFGAADRLHRDLRAATAAAGAELLLYHRHVAPRDAERALRVLGGGTVSGGAGPGGQRLDWEPSAELAPGRPAVLVCTDQASRGLDLPNVQHVIQAEFALNAVDFLHRMGRTARAGKEGRVTLLVSPDEALLGDAIRAALDAGAPLEGVFSRRRSLAKKARKYGGFVARGAVPESPGLTRAPRSRAPREEDSAPGESRARSAARSQAEAETPVSASASERGWGRGACPTPTQPGRQRLRKPPAGPEDERRAERLGLGESGSRRVSMTSWMKRGSSRRGAQESGPWMSAGFERRPRRAADEERRRNR